MQAGPGERLLAGKYRLIRELGQGGMGAVWYAEHVTLKSPVAIKIISPAIAADPTALARFLREAQAAASLRSPHVVQILDHGVEDAIPFIVMELLEGEPLAARLERLGRLSAVETSRFITHVSRAIARAHEAGIVHRDLKPDNIFIVWNDDEEIAKVLDFGVAKSGVALGGSSTVTGTLLGTPYYMSPEQAEGRDVDYRSDIWALGVIASECLTGQRPFNSDTLPRLLMEICERPLPVPSRIGEVPLGFDAWFARACARDPLQRYGSAKEAAQALRELCQRDSLDNAGIAASLSGSLQPRSFDGSGQRVPSASGLSATLEPVVDFGQHRRRRTLLVAAAFGVPLLLALLVLALRAGGNVPDVVAHGGGPASSVSIPPHATPAAAPPRDAPGAVLAEEPAPIVPDPKNAEQAPPILAPTPVELSKPAAPQSAPRPRAAGLGRQRSPVSKPTVPSAAGASEPAPRQTPAKPAPNEDVDLGI